jgi:hypothetical protein
MTAEIRSRLVRFYGEPLVARCETFGIKVVPLGAKRRYSDASASLLRLGVDVDAWPVPPVGLFVVEERSVYLRSPKSDMTLAHEFGHAIDCMLGGGEYLSSQDRAIRSAFSNARDFVTPYAATGLDEYFAEALRAYAGVNDTSSPWPKATRERLLACDPAIHHIVERIFAEVAV